MDRFRLTAHVESAAHYALVFARPDRRLGPNIFLTKTPCKIEGDCTDTNSNGIASGTTRHGGR
jgi:hypothetical protein